MHRKNYTDGKITIRVIAGFTKAQYGQLRKIAYKDHVSQATILRTAFDHYVDNVVNARERDI